MPKNALPGVVAADISDVTFGLDGNADLQFTGAQTGETDDVFILTVELTATNTAAILAARSTHSFDLQVTANGRIYTPITGRVSVTGDNAI